MMRLHEEAHGWSLDCGQAIIQQIRIDYQVSLRLTDGPDNAWLRVETAFSLREAGNEEVLDPERTRTLAPVLRLFNTAVRGLTLDNSGHLRLQADDIVLEVVPDENYEAWQFAGSFGRTEYKLICSPGGGIVVFTSGDPHQ